MKCTLYIEDNTCPFFKDNQCINKEKCSFQEQEKVIRNKYVRKPRWYEDYYKKK